MGRSKWTTREIRRWKEAEQEQFSSAHTAVHANSSNADWATLPLTIPTPAFQAQPNETQPQAGWGEPPPAQGAQQQPTNTDIGTAASWLPPTSNSSQDGGNNGDNGLNSEMIYRQSQQQNFGHANSTSIVTKDRPDGSVTSSNNHLNPHIEQIQHAVNRKLINVAALTSPAVASNPQILLDLTKLIKRFMDKEHELTKFQQQQHQHQQSAVYKNEEERLICEINSAKSELAELQRSICSGGGSSSNIQIPSNQSNGNPSNNSLSSSTDGQSRLQQWKKTNHNDDPNKDSIGAGLQSLISASQSLSIQSGQENGSGNDWKSGALDWSPPSSGVGMDTAFGRKEDQFLALTSASSVQMTNTMSGSGPGMQQYNHFDGHDTGEYGHEGGNGAMDDGPLEFVPAKSGSGVIPTRTWRAVFKWRQNVNSQHGQGGADQRNFNAWTGGNATPYPTNNSNPASEMWNNKARSGNIPPVGGPPPSGLMSNPPNRLMGPPPSILGPAYPSGNPAGMPPGTGNRGQFGPGPGTAPINAGVYWILFQLVNINDQQSK
uniref:GW182 middle domain-containing protein n=1 Tax=Ditylenchus dipsaci TaxID=166011 RepID=A0A915CQM1_9BILA